jgi:hypothetical protein
MSCNRICQSYGNKTDWLVIAEEFYKNLSKQCGCYFSNCCAWYLKDSLMLDPLLYSIKAADTTIMIIVVISRNLAAKF